MDSPSGGTPRSTPVRLTPSTIPRGQHHTKHGHSSSLLEDVLAEKKMALMQSPEVICFLQNMQQEVRREKVRMAKCADLDQTLVVDAGREDPGETEGAGREVTNQTPGYELIHSERVINNLNCGASTLVENARLSKSTAVDGSQGQNPGGGFSIRSNAVLGGGVVYVSGSHDATPQTMQTMYVAAPSIMTSAAVTSHHIPVPTVPTALRYVLHQRPGHTLPVQAATNPQQIVVPVENSATVPRQIHAVQPTSAHTILHPTSAHTIIQPTSAHTILQPTSAHTILQPTSAHTILQSIPTTEHVSQHSTQNLLPVSTRPPCASARQTGNLSKSNPGQTLQSIAHTLSQTAQAIHDVGGIHPNSSVTIQSLSHSSQNPSRTLQNPNHDTLNPSHPILTQTGILPNQNNPLLSAIPNQNPSHTLQNLSETLQDLTHASKNPTQTLWNPTHTLNNPTHTHQTPSGTFLSMAQTSSNVLRVEPDLGKTVSAQIPLCPQTHPLYNVAASSPGDMHSDPNKTCLVTEWLNANIDVIGDDAGYVAPDADLLTSTGSPMYHLPNFYRENDDNT